MPRCFFNIADGDTTHTDLDGVELPNMEAARRHAIEAARDLIYSLVTPSRDWGKWRVEIADASGQMLMTIWL